MSDLQEVRSWCLTARPVFVCGLERSGTSMLQLSLSRHPELFNVKDVYETFAFVKPRSLLADPPPEMTKAYLKGLQHAADLRQRASGLAPAGGQLSEVDVIRLFFHYCAEQVYPGRRPLEKTPGHVRKIARMLELFPRGRVVACTREPVAIVASYRKRLAKEQSLGKGRDEWGWLDKTPEQLVDHFKIVTERLQEARARWPQQVFVAPYDWLTESPEPALQALCEFAGLPYTPALLAPENVPNRKVDELLSRPISRRDNTDEDARWVDAATAAWVREHTAELMPVWNTPGCLEPVMG